MGECPDCGGRIISNEKERFCEECGFVTQQNFVYEIQEGEILPGETRKIESANDLDDFYKRTNNLGSYTNKLDYEAGLHKKSQEKRWERAIDLLMSAKTTFSLPDHIYQTARKFLEDYIFRNDSEKNRGKYSLETSVAAILHHSFILADYPRPAEKIAEHYQISKTYMLREKRKLLSEFNWPQSLLDWKKCLDYLFDPREKRKMIEAVEKNDWENKIGGSNPWVFCLGVYEKVFNEIPKERIEKIGVGRKAVYYMTKKLE